MNSHLVAVEVCVEGGARERAQLQGLAVDEHGLERLNAQAVKSRRAIQENRMLLDHLGKDVPDLGMLLLHHLLRGLDGGDVSALLQLGADERLEEF